ACGTAWSPDRLCNAVFPGTFQPFQSFTLCVPPPLERAGGIFSPNFEPFPFIFPICVQTVTKVLRVLAQIPHYFFINSSKSIKSMQNLLAFLGFIGYYSGTEQSETVPITPTRRENS